MLCEQFNREAVLTAYGKKTEPGTVGRDRTRWSERDFHTLRPSQALVWVKATFGTAANLDQSGTIQSHAPLILETRLTRLSEAGTTLGGSARETIVEKVSRTCP
jgi:hypothetical protein